MTLWVGTSWKMTKLREEARLYAAGLATAALSHGWVREGEDRPAERPWPGVQPFVIPSLTSLGAVCDTLGAALGADGPVVVGAQNAHWQDTGAWTGEVSVPQLADAGASLVELGHSERREHFGEDDTTVRRKTAAVVRHGLVPLVCVGETQAEREAGRAVEVTARQIEAALDGHRDGIGERTTNADSQVPDLLVAYEPVWAIGDTGREPRPEELVEVVSVLHDTATARGTALGGLLYGGSVNPQNAGGLLDVPGIDGLFVGRSAWAVDDFVSILDTAATHGAATTDSPTRAHQLSTL